MDLLGLTGNLKFELDFMGDGVDSFDYAFAAEDCTEKTVYTNLTSLDLKEIIKNCRKIIDLLTDHV